MSVVDEPLSLQTCASESSASNDEYRTSQELLSQLSVHTRLPVMNAALQLLDESPIPKKKLKREYWLHKRNTLTRSLEITEIQLNAQNDAHDLHDIISRLKEKIHNEQTSRAAKIQILTVLPMSWSVEKMCQIMNVSRRMARNAKNLAITKGILSTPNAKCG